MTSHGGPRLDARDILSGICAVALLLAAMAALVQCHVLDSFQGNGLFALGFLMLAGSVAGHLTALIRLPRITGYLLAGILSGPHASALIDEGAVKDLSLVNGLALALIALMAGAEITLPTLRRTWRSVLWSSTAQSIVVVPPLALGFVVAARFLPFARSLPLTSALAVGLVWSVVCLSRSPSVTLAILAETRARGPVTDHALGVVVILDVVVLALFSFAIGVAGAAISGADLDPAALQELAASVFASICAGTTFGLMIALYFRLVRSERILFIVAAAYAITALSNYLRYDTLLVFVVAGFVVTNLTKLGHELLAASERLSGVVLVVFFATAGAKLDLQALLSSWPVALSFVVARIVLTRGACWLGHALAGDPPVVRRFGHTAFVSQAGVTIGLVTIIAERLPTVGAGLASLGIAVVGVNELIGPIWFKLGLTRAGEIPTPPPR